MKKQLDKAKALKYLSRITNRIKEENNGTAADYADLQYTWNKDILERSFDYIPASAEKLIGVGSFMGTLEMALAPFFDQVTCVDFESFLPDWKPENIRFHAADIDSNDWELPTRDAMFDICYCVETIEHLLWSPLPLLNWMRTYSHVTVISTPDNEEWPKMNIRPWTRYQNYRSIPAASPGVKGNPEPMNHCKQYNQAELIDMFDYAGFRVVEFFRTGTGGHQMCAILTPRI